MTRIARSLVTIVGAAVALTALAGAAQADQPAPSASGAEISAFPARAVLVGNQTPAQFVTAKVAVPTGLACESAMTARVVGHRDAVLVSTTPDCTVAGFAKWTVTANAIAFKRNAVVKFIATNPADSARTVSSLGVKLNPGARPAMPAPSVSGAVITVLPAKAALLGGQSPAQFVTVTVAVPTGLTCATDLRAVVVGQRDTVAVPTAPNCAVAGSASWTVTAGAFTHKRHGVVKFLARSGTDDSATIGTLNVRVNPGAKPAKPAKPNNGRR